MPTRKAAAAALPAVTLPAAKASKGAVAPKAASKQKAAVKAARKANPPAPAAPAKTKVAAPAKVKPKLVRDSFTMPKAEYAAIDALKQRAAQLARSTKKSELLRAGIKALSAMNDETLLAALQAVPTIKTGRPNKG